MMGHGVCALFLETGLVGCGFPNCSAPRTKQGLAAHLCNGKIPGFRIVVCVGWWTVVWSVVGWWFVVVQLVAPLIQGC